MKPWIDRRLLISQATEFVQRHGFVVRHYAKRISGLVEIAVYNSIVSYYEARHYELEAKYLGRNNSFKYRIKSSGLIESFSCFEASSPSSKDRVLILQNVKVQSAHDGHLYYTPDVVVCAPSGALTVPQKSGKRHSYISNDGLITFVEVKHLIPSPELIFSFTGLVVEFRPAFTDGKAKANTHARHLAPAIVFTGVPSEHSERIRSSLIKRYGFNVIFGTQNTGGRIASFSSLLKYDGA